MTEPVDKSQDAGSQVPLIHTQDAGQPASNVGSMLRALREARNMSLSEVSARLKFSARQLNALEQERWEDLPQGMSLRGLVRNYARFLRADPDALLDALERQVGASVASPSVAVNRVANRYQESDLPLHDEPSGRPWGWLIIILVVLFIAVFYAIERAWIPESWLLFDWLKSIQK